MSDPSDDRPIAPPRPLTRPTDQPAGGSAYAAPAYSGQSPSQPAMRGQYAGSSSAYPGGDSQTERTMPVSAMPTTYAGPGGAGAQPSSPPVGARADQGAERSTKRFEAGRPRTVRRAKLRLVRLDPWSVTKASFLLSIAFGIMCVVAVFLVVSILNASGLWDSVNTTIQGLIDQRPKDAFDIKQYVGINKIMGITMLIAAIDVIIITALATLGAFIYNMAASLLGGVEVTLAEDLR